MKNIRAAVALFLVAVFLAGVAYATTSSINPNVPAQNSPLSSSVLRGNFGDAYNDENTIYGILTLSSNQLLGTVNAGMAGPLNLPSCPLGGLSWTPGTGFGCTNIAGIISPVTNALVFTGAFAVNYNAVTLPTKQTGTVIQFGDADGITSRLEADCFAAPCHFTGVRADGTNAAPTTLQSGDEIASFNAFGYNGSATVGPRAAFRTYASQNWTGSAQGTYADVATTLAGTTTLVEAIRFENDGGIDTPGVTGGSCGAGCLNVGALKVNNVAVVAGQTITLSGDASGSGSTAITVTNNKVNGVTYSASPSTNTVPVITASNVATYEALPLAAMASVNANNVLGAATTGAPAALSVPSCSGASNALIWTAGTGFGCNTISSGSGSGTVNSGTTPDLGYYATSTTALSDATGLQYNSTTKGLNLNGVNAHSLPDNGADTTGVSIGASAYLVAATTGQDGTAVGASALAADTTGTKNTAIGYSAGSKITTGGNNTILGALVGSTTLVSGSDNILVGVDATTDAVAATTTSAVGIGQGVRVSSGDVAIGYLAQTALTGGSSPGNVIIGSMAGSTNGNAIQDVFIGYSTGKGDDGSQNVCVGGESCGGENTVTASGTQNVVAGFQAWPYASSGGNNVLLGYQVATNLQGNGAGNVIIGSGANSSLSTTSNGVAVGAAAIVGTGDTAVGNSALHATVTNGLDNTAVGSSALAANTTGLGNVAVGYEAGDTGTNNCVTCTNSTLVGYEAALGSTATTNANAFGYEAVAQASNDVTLGNSSIATIHAEVTTITAISDRRHKKDIKPLDLGLDFVSGLKPVSYRLKTSDSIERFGFIAQDTEAALPTSYRSIVDGKDSNNRIALIEVQDNKEGTYRMGYDELIAPLVKSIQQLKAINDNQQKEIDDLKARIKAGN